MIMPLVWLLRCSHLVLFMHVHDDGCNDIHGYVGSGL